MKYLKFLPIVLAVIFLSFYYFFIDKTSERESLQSTEQTVWETKSDNQSPVTVTVTPLEMGKNTKTWKFQIILDTHSGSLDDDLLRVAILIDDKGNVYPPTTWEGPGPGGHHRNGILIFNSIQPFPKYVELKIKDVGGIPVRSFRWGAK